MLRLFLLVIFFSKMWWEMREITQVKKIKHFALDIGFLISGRGDLRYKFACHFLGLRFYSGL